MYRIMHSLPQHIMLTLISSTIELREKKTTEGNEMIDEKEKTARRIKKITKK